MPSFFSEKFFGISSFAMARFVLWGTYCTDALVKRAPYRDKHLARLQGLKDQGTLVTLGPTERSTHVFGIFEADSLDKDAADDAPATKEKSSAAEPPESPTIGQKKIADKKDGELEMPSY